MRRRPIHDLTASNPGFVPITPFMPTDVESILKLEVPVIVQIASRMMSVREVAALGPGAIIELPKLADEELEIRVSNRTIGTGTAVKVGENFGLRITYVGNLKQRIRAMGGDEAVVSNPEEVVVAGLSDQQRPESTADDDDDGSPAAGA